MQHLPTQLWQWDAADLAPAIRRRAISAREATQACLDRLAAVNPRLNAVVTITAETALREAEAADQAVRQGAALGPLHGVPLTTKINVDFAGLPNTNGCVPLAEAISPGDSAVVGNLRAAGAVFLGRTNTPALSMRWFTENALHGRTLNPWSARHTPGGSSGGAAAAVAAGIGPIAHGNDLGGSIRYPAYACGIAGIRPSFGRVPAYNPSMASERPLSGQLMSTQGPLARRVRDLRLALAAMAAPDARDPWHMPVPLTGPTLPGPLRVAFCVDPMGAGGVHPEVRAAILQAAAWLEDAGYRVEEAAPPAFAAAAQDWDAFAHGEALLFMRQNFERLADDGARATFGYMVKHTRPPELTEMLQIAARRTGHQRAWALWQQQYPLLLPPVSNEPPFPQGLDLEGQQGFDRVYAAQQPLLASPLLGVPGASVPTGLTTEGLPMGVQLTGPRWREDIVLDAAEVIEARANLATPIDPRP